MLHLEPIFEGSANARVTSVYADIKKTLDIYSVPLMFQLIANFEEYLSHIWIGIEKNVEDPAFSALAHTFQDKVYKHMKEIYTPTEATITYLKKSFQVKEELYAIQKDSDKIVAINSFLFFISTALRESIKGYSFGASMLSASRKREETITQKLLANESSVVGIEQDFALALSETGMEKVSSSLAHSFFPRFLAVIASEVEDLIQKESYIVKRVETEKYVQNILPDIPHPLNSSYMQIMGMIAHKPYHDELLYLLYDTFPTLAVYKLNTSLIGKILLEEILNST